MRSISARHSPRILVVTSDRSRSRLPSLARSTLTISSRRSLTPWKVAPVLSERSSTILWIVLSLVSTIVCISAKFFVVLSTMPMACFSKVARSSCLRSSRLTSAVLRPSSMASSIRLDSLAAASSSLCRSTLATFSTLASSAEAVFSTVFRLELACSSTFFSSAWASVCTVSILAPASRSSLWSSASRRSTLRFSSAVRVSSAFLSSDSAWLRLCFNATSAASRRVPSAANSCLTSSSVLSFSSLYAAASSLTSDRRFTSASVASDCCFSSACHLEASASSLEVFRVKPVSSKPMSSNCDCMRSLRWSSKAECSLC
mmetsp:Transcript_69129/g.150407  ORF Transcript_69129/g.150407 Transcript_69129/m.150407 type:complete len:316 (+) Transcript_69129:416-1363(+)